MPATSTDRLYGLTTSVAVKPPVQISADYNVITFGEQTITSTTFTGTRTVTTTKGMRVLLTGQSNPIDNGIWEAMPATWKRAPDFDGARDSVNGTLVFSVYGDCWQVEAADPVRIGYDPIQFRSTYPFSDTANLYQRTLRVPESYIDELPELALRVNKQLGFDASGNPALLDPADTGSLGYILVDSFEDGALITSRYQALHYISEGEYYRWDGPLPKSVPINSTPLSSGGIGQSAWVSVGDASTRKWVTENFERSTYYREQGGDFLSGITVISPFQIVYYPTDGHWYRYLVAIPSGGLIVPPDSSPDGNWENVDTQQVISLRKLNELSTSSIAGYVGVNIDMPVSVKDADNQGAKVGNGVSISGDGSSQTSISTTKLQTALRLDGDDITIVNVNGSGNADNTNTSTSEFISSRMAGEVDGRNLKRLTVRGANINGFTTGIALTAINGAIIQDVRARNMRYSPTGLNSAGGYLIVCGGNAKHIITNNIQHTLVEQADRHTLYISAASGDTPGWSYWNISNVDSDYSANSVNNKGANGVPFAMSPIHIRNGKNLNLVNHMVEGYMCSAFDFENQFGSINNTNISNIVATESQSFQNGTLTDQGVLRVGYDQYSSINQHHNFNNFIVKMIRGTDNSGVKMAVGSDNGVWAAKLQFANFVNGQITTESGNAFKLYNSSYVNIDNIIDRQIDTTSSANAIFLSNCSNITIGSNIQSNRTVSSTKERVYTIDTASTEITCRFPRRVVLRVTSGAVTIVEDRWDMLSGVPAISGSNILVPLKNHVSTNSKRTATVENLTAANVKAVRIDDADAVTLRFGLWDTSTNASAPASTASNTVAINFTS